MTPLRERMIRAKHMHGYSPRTHESYLAAVTGLARFTRRSPDALSQVDLARYFEHLTVERQLAPASVRLKADIAATIFTEIDRAQPVADPDHLNITLTGAVVQDLK